jgi:MFS family permease
VEEAIEKMGFGPFQILITVFSGLLWLADAMELMLLSVLSPAVQCEWGLTKSEEATITSVVFVGFLLGGIFWGVLSDAIGRKRVSTCMLLIGTYKGTCIYKQ